MLNDCLEIAEDGARLCKNCVREEIGPHIARVDAIHTGKT